MARKKLWKQIKPEAQNSSSREYIREDVNAHLMECSSGLLYISTGEWVLYINEEWVAHRRWYGRRLHNPPFTWANKEIENWRNLK